MGVRTPTGLAPVLDGGGKRRRRRRARRQRLAAIEQRHLVAVQGFPLEQRQREAIQQLAVLAQDAAARS
jgi:hypothetical protein